MEGDLVTFRRRSLLIILVGMSLTARADFRDHRIEMIERLLRSTQTVSTLGWLNTAHAIDQVSKLCRNDRDLTSLYRSCLQQSWVEICIRDREIQPTACASAVEVLLTLFLHKPELLLLSELNAYESLSGLRRFEYLLESITTQANASIDKGEEVKAADIDQACARSRHYSSCVAARMIHHRMGRMGRMGPR